MAEMWDVLDEKGNKTGRLHERGTTMQQGDFHLVVEVWITNQKGDFLVSKRTPERNGLWHTTGGCAITGDDSLTAALREVQEEIGIILSPNARQLFKRFNDNGNGIHDVWLFSHEVDISDTILCPVEISDAKWVSQEQIRNMTNDGSFAYPYLDELFYFCNKIK